VAVIIVARRIYAPHDVVFSAVADARAFAGAVPGVIAVEFLSDVRSGPGTRFRRIRSTPVSVDNRVARHRGDIDQSEIEVSDFEVTEYIKNERLRIVNETRGAVWDSIFTITPIPNATLLSMRSEVRSHPFIARLVMPIVAFFRRKAIEAEINAVKVYCEQPAARHATNPLMADAPPRALPA
jgi:hypothetical protein